MMSENFPFSSNRARLHVTHGNTSDRFMHFTGVELRFDEIIFDHLRRHGFECIAFFGHRGCYFFDEQSLRHCAPQALDNQGAGLVGHSLGIRLTRPRVSMPDPAGTRWCFPDMTQIGQLVDTVREILANQVRTAVVFSDLHLSSLLEHNSQLRLDFNALVMNELGQLPTDNKNILLLNIPGDPGRHLERLGWSDLLQCNDGPGLAQARFIGPPDVDEVEHWLFSQYLRGALEIVWEDWDLCVRELTSSLKRHNHSLNALGQLLDEKELSTDTVQSVVGDDMGRNASELLKSLVGLDVVKEYIARKQNSFLRRLPEGVVAEQGRQDLLRLVPPAVDPRIRELNLHLILTGNPGTGKTTVCRLLGALYRECGLLPLGHVVKVTRQDLVGQYVGTTAPKTRACIERALGGILFIDDAYALYKHESDSFGQEALDTLVEAMTDLTGRLAVVMAGYPGDMDRLLTANAGLRDRFDQILEIEDYKPDEMEQILRNALLRLSENLPLEEELDSLLPQLCNSIYGNRNDEYANARSLENIAREMVEKAVAEGAASVNKGHLPKEYVRYVESIETSDLGIVEALDALIGLGQVKEKIATLMDRIEVKQRRMKETESPNCSLSGHFIFSGNPGTGKTTVARILARQFFSMGLLASPDIHEQSAASFVKGFVGQTRENTTAFLEAGLGKLIFIDEAHQLNPAGVGSDFRRDVLEVLVPFSENNRQKCIIILAGYEKEMNQMLQADPGLESRFRNRILFEDYTAAEMIEIFDFFVTEDSMHWPGDSLTEPLQRIFSEMKIHNRASFANARTVRNFYEECLDRHASRLKGLSDEHLDFLSAEDLGLQLC